MALYSAQWISTFKRAAALLPRSGTDRTKCNGPDVLHQFCLSVILVTACTDWPLRSRDWLHEVQLGCVSRMALKIFPAKRALRPGMFFASLASTGAPQCIASRYDLCRHCVQCSIRASLPDEVGLASCQRQPCINILFFLALATLTSRDALNNTNAAPF